MIAVSYLVYGHDAEGGETVELWLEPVELVDAVGMATTDLRRARL